MPFSEQLKQFLEQAATGDLRTAHYDREFEKVKVRVSFGAGNQARIPWIAFLRDGQKVSLGIYPVYLFYKSEKLLILSYGLSETNPPNQSWPELNVPTVGQYFAQNGLGVCERYNNSLVYRAYDAENLPADKELDDDLLKLIDFYKEVDLDTLPAEVVDNSDIIMLRTQFLSEADKSGLSFSDGSTTRFLGSLITKPFLILTGLSGSGKTKLAHSFAKWICKSKDQYNLVAVGADWTSREPLLGFPNALDPKKYVKPDNGILDLLIRAYENPTLPYFLILDEMNLSHVERYFADFLSAMESGDSIKLHSGEVDDGTPSEIKIPRNLFIIGTVNIDETTYMFSPKVLDRANTIEFRVSNHEIARFLTELNHVSEIENVGASMAANLLEKANQKPKLIDPDKSRVKDELVGFFDELAKVGAEFGYRTAYEIQLLIANLGEIDTSMEIDDKIDAAVIQKLLPKLHGSRRKLTPVLETLARLCLIEPAESSDYENIDLQNREVVKFPLSLEKILRMRRNVIDNGFTSFAEA